tara:strand:- start:69 stop:320 length:252 start_codon:yes stop_codon:yes gene_type:complete
MLSGNTYTFLYIEKYNIAHSKPKPKPINYTKPVLSRSKSRSYRLDKKNEKNEENKNNENQEDVISEEYLKNYFNSDNSWDSEW